MFRLPGKPKLFIDREAHLENRGRQTQLAPRVVSLLREQGVSSDEELKVEYFFYTNTADKAEALAEELANMGYEVEYGPSASDSRTQVVTGWTQPMLMAPEVMSAWSGRMCDLGLQHDCEFDGWGTTPDQ